MSHFRHIFSLICLLPVSALADVTPADHAALEQIAQQQHVIIRPPAPSFQLYFGERLQQLSQWLSSILTSILNRFSTFAASFPLFALILAGGVLLLGLILIFYFLASQLHRKHQPTTRAPGSNLEEHNIPTPRDADSWKASFARALASGEISFAMESLWYWIASLLVGEIPDPSWTSPEMLQACARGDLLTLFQRLDRWRYGPEAPVVSSLQELAADMERAAS